MQTPALIEKIYEAAFDPAQWSDVLEHFCKLSDSTSGEFLVFEGPEVRHWKATGITRDLLHEFARRGSMYRLGDHHVRLLDRAAAAPLFRLADVVLTRQEFSGYTIARALDELGLGVQLGAVFPLQHDGGRLVFSFERRNRQGRHNAAAIERLNALLPHFARAGLIASRLGLEHARGALAALTALDLPAALLDARGRLHETNALLTPALLDTRGGDRVALGDPAADALLNAVLCGDTAARSIALAPRPGRAARVVHAIRLAAAVRDPFASATTLLVVQPVAAEARSTAPDPAALRVLFDLSPAESRLAALLATGVDLARAAGRCGIRPSTARSYLEKIFQKTGCHRQGELVALLGGLRPAALSRRDSDG